MERTRVTISHDHQNIVSQISFPDKRKFGPNQTDGHAGWDLPVPQARNSVLCLSFNAKKQNKKTWLFSPKCHLFLGITVQTLRWRSHEVRNPGFSNVCVDVPAVWNTLRLCCCSQILDEVERRRGVSAALVYPFMRSLMESPFPAPGKLIKVKTFLPGAGNEVRAADNKKYFSPSAWTLPFSWITSEICEVIFFLLCCVRSWSWGGPATPDWNTWTLTVCLAAWVFARSSESLPLCCWSVESSLWLINSGEAEDSQSWSLFSLRCVTSFLWA